MSVTAIIPVKNRLPELEKLLESMERLTYKPVSIIIIDDCSNEPIPDLKVTGIPITIIRMIEPIGAPGAKNVAARMAKTPYVWFLDSDCVICDVRCLYKMVYSLKNNLVGAVGGEIHRVNDNLYLNLETVYPNMDTKVEYIKAGNKSPWIFNSELIGTNNMLVCNHLLQEYNGFKNHFPNEDKLFSFWIRKQGYILIESESFAVLHNKISSVRQNSFFKWELLRATNQIKISILLLPWYKILYFPILDIVSKLYYLRDRKQRLALTNGVNKFSMYKAPKWYKGIVFLTVWVMSYFYGIYYILIGDK